ncbi:MAG: hypothetical protein MZV49_06625 [Rhodopseudomonas palustris]|nr:hypothetical protein [Rhodopseudomonas palustris]
MDAISLTSLLVILSAELMVLGLSVWLLFLTTRSAPVAPAQDRLTCGRRTKTMMPRIKSRLLWGVGLAAGVLIGAAAYVYFVGTRTVLEQAEAFVLRRMTVSQLSEQGVFRFFYATNRAPVDELAPIESRFGSERDDALRFGAFETRSSSRSVWGC